MKLLILFFVSMAFISSAMSRNDRLKPQQSFKLCYQNVFGQSPHQDIEILWFDLHNNQITGEFNWFPALQAKRTGQIMGRMHRAVTAHVVYSYQQNKQSLKTQLTLSLSQHYIFINASNGSEHLTTALKRVSCSILVN